MRRFDRQGGALLVHPKLTVGRAREAEEHEADRAAEAAMSDLGASAGVHRAGSQVADRLGGQAVDAGFEARINRARADGAPLEPSTRDRMQSAFGTDLGGVRLHTGSTADELSRSLEAKAFTTGRDIFFRSGAYAPQDSAGLGLLAHEVAHVVQQGGVVHRAVVRRAFDPKNPNPGSITAATRLSGGLANKGVFLLTGQGGAEVVAKFVDEDPRRAQMADVVLGSVGVGASASEPYGMDVGGRIIAKVREAAKAKRKGGDDVAAKYLEDGADLAERDAKGVVLMNKMAGTDLGDILAGYAKDAPADLRQKAQASGVSPISLLRNTTFHYNLGRLYVADGLLGSADRLTDVPAYKVQFNTKNLKPLANGTINTFDSDTVLLAHNQLIKKQLADQSAENWTKWLLQGGQLLTKVGVSAPGSVTQDLVTMFDVATRQRVHAEVVATFKSLADSLDWSTFDLPFAAFDKNFMRGIVNGLTRLTADLDDLIKRAEKIGGADLGQGALDPAALKIKGEYLKTVAPELRSTGAIGDVTKATGTARALALAEKIAPKQAIDQRAEKLVAFDKTLLPVPVREASMDTTEKMGRSFGRFVGSIGGSSAKSQESKAAKQLRKGADTKDRQELDKAYQDVGKMGGASHRKVHAQFDIGLRRSVLAVHGRAIDLGDADDDIMKLNAAVTNDPPAIRVHLTPYASRLQGSKMKDSLKKFGQVITGYRGSLNRGGDTDANADLDRAEKALNDARDGFEASVEFIDRQLKKAGV